MTKRIEYIKGEKIGSCVYLKDTKINGHRYALFICSYCGNKFEATIKDIKSGKQKSCGCYRKSGAYKIKHGLRYSREYNIWSGMKARCSNPNEYGYKNYGARGIKVCDEWQNDFMAFYNHIITLPHYGEPGRSIDRIDNNGNYEPGNMRWATDVMQMANRRNTKKQLSWQT